MPSDGKVIGAFLGGLLGGPWGALVGGVVGALFDEETAPNQARVNRNAGQQRQPHQRGRRNSRSRQSQRSNRRPDQPPACRPSANTDELVHLLSILGLSPPATLEEVQRRYRTIAREFHPDTLAYRGLDARAQEEARRTFERATETYKALLRLLKR